MAKEFDILKQASEIAEQAWNKWEEVNVVAALQEIDRLLSRITPAKLGVEVVRGRTVTVAEVTDSVNLVYGVFSYPRRAIGVPGRLLTTEVTHQPVLALEEGQRFSPLVYAEDVVGHPLKETLIEHLEAFGSKPYLCQPGGLPR